MAGWNGYEKPRRRDDRSFAFLAFLTVVLLETAAFGYTWYTVYFGQSYVRIHFWRRGNWALIALYAVYVLLFAKAFRAYRIGYRRQWEVIVGQILAAITTNTVEYLQLTLIARWNYRLHWKPIFWLSLVDICIGVLWSVVVRTIYTRIFSPDNALLICQESDTEEELAALADRTGSRYQITQTLFESQGFERIRQSLDTGYYTAVIVSDIPEELRNKVVKYCFEQDLICYAAPSITDIMLGASEKIVYFDTQLQYLKDGVELAEESFLKRAGDLVISSLILIFASPLMLLTALLIKLNDGGPVFVHYPMLTKNGEVFHLTRFRIRNNDYEGSWRSEDYVKRFTRIGKFINRTHIAGLPQLFNVLKGEISLVGPRPYTAELTRKCTEECGPEFLFRLRVKAGITGYAQLHGKKRTGVMNRLKLDLMYIENFSVRNDCLILIRSLAPHGK